MTNLDDVTHQPGIPHFGSATALRIVPDLAHLARRNAHWLLRAALASVFVYHGLLKLTRLEVMVDFLQLPIITVTLVALAELTGGVFILAGGFAPRSATAAAVTRLGAVMIVPVMIGAIALVHWGQWSFVPSATHPLGGAQFQVTLPT